MAKKLSVSASVLFEVVWMTRSSRTLGKSASFGIARLLNLLFSEVAFEDTSALLKRFRFVVVELERLKERERCGLGSGVRGC